MIITAKTIKFTISDDNHTELLNRAKESNLSVQDYIRRELKLSNTAPITPQDAIERALQNHAPGDTFTVPSLYGEAWCLPNGTAGQFGRKFFKLVESEYSRKIRFTGEFNNRKHAIYEII